MPSIGGISQTHLAGFTPFQARLSSPLHPRQSSRRRSLTVLATTATSPDQQPSSTLVNTNPEPDVHIRPVSSSDYWAVADMHCSAFYPRANSFWGPVLRLDRVMGLQIGQERDIVQKAGRCQCLLAISEDSLDWKPEPITPTTKPRTLGFFVDTIANVLFPTSMKENYAAEYTTAGILGAVVIDTLLEHIPPKRSNINGGYIRELPRKKMAYLSNLAVAPTAQRRGLGLKLLQKAEEMASREWGCRTMTLHVDPSNTPAVELYKNSGYRFVAKQPEWQRMLEGRQTALALMLKVLPKKSRNRSGGGGGNEDSNEDC
ncbi:hypothetical protein Ndes2437B_g00905 [Nannochloris sp. 'desiccata']